MNAAEREDLMRALASSDSEGRAFLIAERPSDHQRLGFIYVATAVDFFTGEEHAHIKDIVVAREGEGHGVASSLLAAAEDWARSKGYGVITLSVFPGNERARQLYERVGYDTDVLRMLKLLE